MKFFVPRILIILAPFRLPQSKFAFSVTELGVRGAHSSLDFYNLCRQNDREIKLIFANEENEETL